MSFLPRRSDQSKHHRLEDRCHYAHRGRVLTDHDVAHRRIQQLATDNKPLPEGVHFNGRFIYYLGPVDQVGDEVVGPAGPTTSTRLDKFTRMMLEQFGNQGIFGKAGRGDAAIDTIIKNGTVYLMAIGGTPCLVSKAI